MSVNDQESDCVLSELLGDSCNNFIPILLKFFTIVALFHVEIDDDCVIIVEIIKETVPLTIGFDLCSQGTVTPASLGEALGSDGGDTLQYSQSECDSFKH